MLNLCTVLQKELTTALIAMKVVEMMPFIAHRDVSKIN